MRYEDNRFNKYLTHPALCRSAPAAGRRPTHREAVRRKKLVNPQR
jgi:hypothetical protein